MAAWRRPIFRTGPATDDRRATGHMPVHHGSHCLLRARSARVPFVHAWTFGTSLPQPLLLSL
eukprot:10659641-Lingulodinium_polyedra.AAC.1